ncbi:SIMPL domain-containing protein [Duganella aceris]|uniref:SIMPL domain-containing protein n=1 Tax=Duganella aceris TaxID=2703883 RepID=A0ABX0FHD7_9BURK|nr:SIMPL domain-containing protein [Duganella aceris]NGZ83945.1 SIMPL domain-containing protein [Duganella aceris]
MFKPLALAVALLPFAVHASSLPDYPFVHAGGEGFLMVAPDMGEIDFDLSAFDPDPAAAVATVQARAAEVRALLAEQGGEGEHGASAEVRDVRKEMRKSANPDPAAAPEYDIRSSVHIVVRDLGRWRAIMSALLAMANVDHLSTTFGRTDRLKVEQELTAVAVKDAQRRAENMAAGFGRKLGAVAAVSSGQLRNLTGAVGLMPGDFYRARAGVTPPQPDKDFLTIDVLKWSQTVDMLFRIK